MNIVQPIKKIEDIQKIKKYLAKKPRNALLFSFGINTGLRISDILSLDVGDVKGRDYIEIREKKTNKYKKHPEKNILRVTEEFSVQKLDRSKRRPDIVLTVNGIPLVVIECKKSSVSIDEGIFDFVDNNGIVLDMDQLDKIEEDILMTAKSIF